jgi:hypothetical protein
MCPFPTVPVDPVAPLSPTALVCESSLPELDRRAIQYVIVSLGYDLAHISLCFVHAGLLCGVELVPHAL